MCKKIIVVLCLLGSLLMAETKFTTVYIGDHEFNVEIADTLEKMALGLMYRGSIPENFGMLFVHDSEQTRSMWMKNTLIHLDLIFLDRDRRVVDMYINVPPCESDPCPSYYSRKRAQYVLELRGNRATELNLKVGDSVFFILPE